ncbi:GerC family germination protein [Paenibacillus illinoisensis]|nr:GerC family germination protein [Paenibacillus illinoisensis]
MEKKLSEEMTVAIEKLIKKIQQHEIDPVGFGFYARAFQYPLYKEVQDQWGKELSRAQFDVEVDLRIAATGAVE